MANIKKYLTKILSARYGRDVRQSIHDALDAVNTSATDSAKVAEEAAKNLENVKLQAEATTEVLGAVKYDGTTIQKNDAGQLYADVGEAEVEFEESTERNNLETGESVSTLWGKVKKFFADLKPHAFSAPINNLLATVTGYNLDATQGRILNEKFNNYLPLTGGQMSGDIVVKKAGSNQATVSVKNANHHAYFTVSTANNIGIWDETLQKWVIKCSPDGTVTVNGIEMKDITWKRLEKVTYGSPLTFPDEWNEMLIFGTNGYYIGTVTLVSGAPQLHYLVGIDSNHIRFTISNNTITLQSSKIDGKENTEATTGFTPYLTVYYR